MRRNEIDDLHGSREIEKKHSYRVANSRSRLVYSKHLMLAPSRLINYPLPDVGIKFFSVTCFGQLNGNRTEMISFQE